MTVISLEKRSIAALSPYRVAPRDENNENIYLDANENPYPREYELSQVCFNRYPESQSIELLKRYSDFIGIEPSNLLISVGGDEAIKLIIQAFCNDENDTVLISPPTFGMYAIDSQIIGAKLVSVPLTKSFDIDVEAILKDADTAKVIFICSPNNPTGNLMNEKDIERVLKVTKGRSIVVLDEAYIEFSSRESFVSRLAEFPHLAIIRTLSKAFGLAGIRCGFTVANPQLIEILQKVIAPYPISQPSIDIAIQALSKESIIYMHEVVKKINKLKEEFVLVLKTLPFVESIYPSEANFLLIKVHNADDLCQYLTKHRIFVKKQSGILENMIRISIGTVEEMQILTKILNNY